MQGGRRYHHTVLTAVARPVRNASTPIPARLGLAISAKSVPRAVDRNRIKRVTRESFRLHQAQLGPFEIVILARNGAGRANRQQLAEALARLWIHFTAVPAKATPA